MDHFRLIFKCNFISNSIHFHLIIIQQIFIFSFNNIMHHHYNLERLINLKYYFLLLQFINFRQHIKIYYYQIIFKN